MTPQFIEADAHARQLLPAARRVARLLARTPRARAWSTTSTARCTARWPTHFVARRHLRPSVSISPPVTPPRSTRSTRWGSGGRWRAPSAASIPSTRHAASIEVHQASAEDYPVVEKLGEELTLHHARSPIFNPYIRESDEASHTFIKGLLEDPEANAHWVGYEDGTARRA